MTDFHFYHPIEVRYADLDPQGHLNNAKYLTYMEQARVQYAYQLGLWGGGSFNDFGMIVAEARVSYRQPVFFGQAVRVGVRAGRLGTKSFKMHYVLEDAQSGARLAEGETVQVAYDYHAGATIPIPEGWRVRITEFEGLRQ